MSLSRRTAFGRGSESGEEPIQVFDQLILYLGFVLSQVPKAGPGAPIFLGLITK